MTGAAALSSQINGDGGAFGAGPTPVEEGEGFYSLALSASQMNFDVVTGVLKTTTSGAKNTPFSIYTVTRQLDDLAFPTVSGRGVDVDATGGVEITVNQAVNVAQWNGSAVAAPTVAGVPEVDVTHVAGTVQTAGDIIGDTNDLQARLPAALVGGRMDASVGAMAANVLTAAAIAADAITAAKIATDAIGSDEFAQAAADKVWASAARTLTAFSFLVDLTASERAAIINAAWDELTAEARTAGSYGQLFKDNVNATIASRSSHSAADVRSEMDANSVDLNALLAFVDELESRLTAARAAALDNLDATVSSRAAPGAAMDLVADAVDAAAVATDAVNEIRDAVFARAFPAAYGSHTFDELCKMIAAVLLAKCSGMGTATGTFRNLADSADVIVASIDADGNRSAVTRTP